jgi:hypothetical protein
MKHKTSIVGLALTLALSSMSAEAQLAHTYVSAKGNDPTTARSPLHADIFRPRLPLLALEARSPFSTQPTSTMAQL